MSGGPAERPHALRAARARPGARLGEYLLERALGSGGMGSVFVGRHVVTGARHALKVLHLGASPERRERFAREARALGKVDRHPGVIRIHRYDVEPDGLAYCALDYVEGGDLEQLLEAHPDGLPLPRALAIAEGLARALAHVHAAGLVHRDLKPANVLLPDGADRPVLTDFGVARDEAEERLTRTQQLVGTPQYMAPEQLMGEQGRVGPATDVFALGVVLYHMLTGTLPFRGGTFMELTLQVCEADPPPPSAARPDLPRDLDRVVARTLDKEPAARPTAAQVAEWLAAVGRDEPLSIAGSSVLSAAVRRMRRRRGLLLSLALALLAAGAVALVLAREDSAGARARAEAVAHAHAEVARLDAGALERLITRAAPDVAAVDSARARLLAVGRRDRAVSEALLLLEEARRRATAELALLRGDDAAAREALAATSGPAAALLALRLAAAAGEPAPAPPDVPAEAAAAVLADAALARGDLDAARRHLEDVRGAALAPLRRVLEARLDVARADDAAARLDGPTAVAALKAAAARDPDEARAAVVRAVARAVEAADPRDAVRFVRTLHAAFPEVALPGAARPFHALAVEAAAERRHAEVVAHVEEGWRVDPVTPPPEALAVILATEGNALGDRGQALEGYAVMLHAVRAGRVIPTPMRRLLQLLRGGTIDAWVQKHPGDWAGRLLRAETLAEGIEERVGADREHTSGRILQDLEVVFAAPSLSDQARDLAEVVKIAALSHRPEHLELVEGLLARGTDHDWRLCLRAAAYCGRTGDAQGELAWGRRAVAAISGRIERIARGEVAVDGQDYFDGAHRLHGAYERLINALARTREQAEVEALLAEVQACPLLHQAGRAELMARLYELLGRWREALEAARRCLELDPGQSNMLRLVERAERRLREQE